MHLQLASTLTMQPQLASTLAMQLQLVSFLTIQLVFDHASMIPTVTKMVTSHASDVRHYTLEHYYQPLPATGGPVSQRLGPKAVVYDLIDSQVVDVLFPFLIVAHVLGILVNLMLSMF